MGHCYESGSSVEIRSTLIVARQFVQKGMDDPPKAEKEGEFDAKLADFLHTLHSSPMSSSGSSTTCSALPKRGAVCKACGPGAEEVSAVRAWMVQPATCDEARRW